MWVEAILSRDDLTRLLGQALPLTVRLGDEADHHSLALFEPEAVTLVADRGVVVVCKARVHWPLLGIDVPIVVSSMTVELRPEIGRTDGHDALFFRAQLLEADLSGIPSMIDRHITRAINARLEESRDALTWDFSTTLAHAFPLPSLLEPLDRFALDVAWGKVRVTDEAVVLALSFHSKVARRGDEEVLAPTPRAVPAALPPRRRAMRRAGATGAMTPEATVRMALVAASFGLAAGAGYFALRAAIRARS